MSYPLPTKTLGFLLLLAGAGMADDAVRLKARTLAAKGMAAVETPLKRHSGGRSHWIIEFGDAPGPERVAALRDAGITVTSAVSGRVVAAAVRDGTDLATVGAVRAARLAAMDKVSPLLASAPAGAYVIEFHADVEDVDARAIVRESGLDLLEHPDLLPAQLLAAGGPEQAAAAAEWDEVAYVFPAAPELVAGERVAACAGGITEQGLVAQYVNVGEGWGPGPLHFFFNNTTSKLDRSTVQSEIVRALGEWARYAPLDFSAGTGASLPRTIAILFARGSHGDGVPFDGAGKILAHTYYPAPPNREPIAGDMHLDDDETWRVGSTVDLFTVALHEAGHALGLGHSDRPGSVMYPYYRQASGLTSDDIEGIRKLYGSRETVVPPIHPSEDPETPSTPPARPPLSIVIVQPASGSVVTTAASIALSGRTQDGAGAVRVEWRSDRGAQGVAEGGANWSIAAAPLSTGSNAFIITATDQEGRTASRTVTVTRQAAQPSGTDANAPPPALRITSPAFTIVSTSLAAITFRGTAAESATSVTWSNSAGGSGTAAGTASWSAEIPVVPGTNTITVRAYGAGGAYSWRSVTVVRR